MIFDPNWRRGIGRLGTKWEVGHRCAERIMDMKGHVDRIKADGSLIVILDDGSTITGQPDAFYRISKPARIHNPNFSAEDFAFLADLKVQY